jgi:hypothetical protein
MVNKGGSADFLLPHDAQAKPCYDVESSIRLEEIEIIKLLTKGALRYEEWV